MNEIGSCVVDANIFVKGVLSPQAPSGGIIEDWRANHRFTPIASKDLLGEVYRALSSPRIVGRYRISEIERRRLIRQIYVRSIFVSPQSSLRICRDPKDDYLIESAILGGANYLVTDDHDILEDQRVVEALSILGVKAVSAIDFLGILKSS